MNLDKQLCNLPLIGNAIERLYSYFKKHIFFADLIHIFLGLGIGLIIADKFLNLGIIFLIIGIFGHIYAYVKGG